MAESNSAPRVGRFTTFERIATALVLLVGLLLTGIAYKLVADAHRQAVAVEFEQRASETTSNLSNTLIRHTNLLIGLQALFHSSDSVSRRQFSRYVASIDRERNHPAAAAISWNSIVSFESAQDFVDTVRADDSLVPGGYPEFNIKPPLSDGKDGIVVTYMEPFEGNERAFGFDIASNEARRVAAHKARDTGKAVITEPIVLTQDSGSEQKAFLMLMPTYSTDNLADVQAKRSAYNGQVVVVTRAAELIERGNAPEVSYFQVLDTTDGQTTPEAERVLYNFGTPLNNQKILETTREFLIGERSWQLFFQQDASQLSLADRIVEYTVLGLGALASLFAALFFYALATARRKAELLAEKLTVDLQRANNELTRSNADLSQFAHVASHDLQTPLRNIISSVNLLEEHLGESKDPEVGELFGFLMKSSERMRTLVTDLLNYARLGRDAIDLAPLELNSVLEEVRLSTLEQCQDSGAQLLIHDLPQVMGDARQINRVFDNLITNAIKYAHPDRSPRIVIDQREDSNDFVQISVEDNSQGIDAKFHDTVFVPFKRLHRHDEIAGTGLGLGICKQIIERHGGNIRIEQSSSQGTTFLLTLPKNM